MAREKKNSKVGTTGIIKYELRNTNLKIQDQNEIHSISNEAS